MQGVINVLPILELLLPAGHTELVNLLKIGPSKNGAQRAGALSCWERGCAASVAALKRNVISRYCADPKNAAGQTTPAGAKDFHKVALRGSVADGERNDCVGSVANASDIGSSNSTIFINSNYFLRAVATSLPAIFSSSMMNTSLHSIMSNSDKLVPPLVRQLSLFSGCSFSTMEIIPAISSTLSTFDPVIGVPPKAITDHTSQSTM